MKYANTHQPAVAAQTDSDRRVPKRHSTQTMSSATIPDPMNFGSMKAISMNRWRPRIRTGIVNAWNGPRCRA